MTLIRTRKIPADNYRGARIRVETIASNGDGFRVSTYPYDYAASNAHEAAALAYLELRPRMFGACGVEYVRETRSGRGNVYRVVTD